MLNINTDSIYSYFTNLIYSNDLEIRQNKKTLRLYQYNKQN